MISFFCLLQGSHLLKINYYLIAISKTQICGYAKNNYHYPKSSASFILEVLKKEKLRRLHFKNAYTAIIIMQLEFPASAYK